MGPTVASPARCASTSSSEPRAKDSLSGVMLWLGAGVDAADGELRLDRSWLPPFRRTLDLEWNPRGREA